MLLQHEYFINTEEQQSLVSAAVVHQKRSSLCREWEVSHICLYKWDMQRKEIMRISQAESAFQINVYNFYCFIVRKACVIQLGQRYLNVTFIDTGKAELQLIRICVDEFSVIFHWIVHFIESGHYSHLVEKKLRNKLTNGPGQVCSLIRISTFFLLDRYHIFQIFFG